MSVTTFYNDVVTRTDVLAYIKKHVTEVAVEKVLARQDVSHIADAMDLIESAFGQMEVDFAPKKQAVSESPR